MGVRILSLIGVSLVLSWFLMNAYLTVSQNKVFSDELNRSYSRFTTSWYSKEMQKKIPYYLKSIPFPNPELIQQYKDKISYGIGYAYLMGSVGVIVGIKPIVIPMIIIHIIQSALFDNPWVTSK